MLDVKKTSNLVRMKLKGKVSVAFFGVKIEFKVAKL